MGDDHMIPVRIVPIHPIKRRRWTRRWLAVLVIMLAFVAYLFGLVVASL